MAGRTVVVTGANSGIGRATAASLLAQGARVVLTGRDADRIEEAASTLRAIRHPGQVHSAVFDLGHLASVRQGAADLLERFDRIDVLINNAGAVLSRRTETPDGFEATFAVNHLGPFLLTNLLLERIRASAPARIVNVASSAHRVLRTGLDFDDLETTRSYSAMRAYSAAKLANILFTQELARRLEGTGVTANALHPGTVATSFARDGDARGLLAAGIILIRPFILTPDRGSRTSVFLASSPDLAGVSGGYFVKCRQVLPSPPARDPQAARRLWEMSEDMIRHSGPRPL